MKQYDTYKDSGIAWIGEIPSEWEVGLIGKYFDEINNPNTNQEETNTLQFKMGEIISKKDGDSKYNPETIEAYNVVEPGTIMINGLNLSFDLVSQRVAQVHERGAITSTYLALSPVNGMESDYAKYLLKAYDNNKALHAMGRGLRATLSYGKFRTEPVLVPNSIEQQSIASFLDTKCGEIDALISLQEEMISELQAYKQSVITEAVTKGLNPHAKMKDSGEDWLNEIPEHWNLLPIRALFTKRNQKNNPIISTERLSLSIGVGITKYADKTTNLDRFKDDFTAYQLAYPEDIVLNSMNMIVGAVGKSAFMGCVSPVYYVITAKEGVSPDFYGYLLNCPKIREIYHRLGRGIYAIERGDGRVNTCRLKVPYYDFSIIKVPVPSYKDQINIASYINEKTSQIDSLISLKQEKIEELKDYKKSIIYEYVTGKKRV